MVCAAVNGFPTMGAFSEQNHIASWTFTAHSWTGAAHKPCVRAGPGCALRMCLYLQITSLGMGMDIPSGCCCSHGSRDNCRLSPDTPGHLPAVSNHLLSYPAAAQDNHKLYKQKLEELTKLQDGISSSIARQKKRLKELSLSLKKCKAHVSPEQEESIQETQSLIKERQNVFFEMEAYLPKKNGFAYKDEYEKFKLYLTIILLIVSSSCRFLFNSRVTDAVFNFLLVWYYCTLTIRESILINNGSKIKGWWVFHHYVSTFLSGVMLTWPDGLMYQMFRNQFLSFSMYQSFVQFLQYYYQSGCLYRLRALGERHNMDLTVEGFQSWMWRGLTFLLPFLFFGQFWQLYNAVTLFHMIQHPECKEWQVLMCGLPFFILFLGNFFTTLRVVHQKFQNKKKDTKRN
ncbi:transmembrane protein 120A isoform 2-T2 [Podargus strigoides]